MEHGEDFRFICLGQSRRLVRWPRGILPSHLRPRRHFYPNLGHVSIIVMILIGAHPNSPQRSSVLALASRAKPLYRYNPGQNARNGGLCLDCSGGTSKGQDPVGNGDALLLGRQCWRRTEEGARRTMWAFMLAMASGIEPREYLRRLGGGCTEIITTY